MKLILMLIITTNLFVSNAFGVEKFERSFDGSEYWYYKTMGRIKSTEYKKQTVVGIIQGRHGLEKYKVLRSEVKNAKSKEQGLLRLFETMVSWLDPSEAEKNTRDFAISKLNELTGLNIEKEEKWIKWSGKYSSCLRLSVKKNVLVAKCE